MRIAHLSDTHVGFRQYTRTTAAGYNQREADVLENLQRVLDDILACEPDIVIHSGDLLDMVRPSNYSVVKLFRALSDFQRKRNGKPFVIIGGNHDTPRLVDSGNLLDLYGSRELQGSTGIAGITVVPREAKALQFKDLDLELLAAPSDAVIRNKTEFAPKTDAKVKVLTLHGAIQGIGDGRIRPHLTEQDTQARRWDYVALGDYHTFTKLAENMCYSGSTEYTSTDIWSEARTPKGWVLFDTDKGEIEHRAVATRLVLDLPAIDAKGMGPGEVSEAIEKAARWPADQMPIVRQVVKNLPVEVEAQIDFELRRNLSSKALFYNLSAVRPEAEKRFRMRATKEGRQSLTGEWEEHIAAATLPFGLDRDEVKETGLGILKEVEELAAAALEA
ncbi:MAG: metallophosphoesterase [Armatimonadetes bacterium]|nr:metallophosphoesterase [Armatimonadota bacterium]